MPRNTPGPIVGLIVGIVLIFVISTTIICIMSLRWYRKHDRSENVDEKIFRKLEMGAHTVFSGIQSSKHHRDSMILGVSKDSINLTRPKFNLRTSNKSSSIPPSRHTISWVINHSPPDSSLKDLQEHFQTRYDSTKTKNSVQKNIIRASDLTQTTRRPATPVRYITGGKQPEEIYAYNETDEATEPQSRRCLEYLYGRTKSRTISACLLGQLQTVAIHVPIVVGLATDVRQSITPVQSGISLESSFSAFANQTTHSSEPTLVTQESESR